MSELNLIVAMDMNNGIGMNGELPWDAPADTAYFRKNTHGCTVIMGRKTHDSILSYNGSGLEGRRSIVVTRSPDKITSGVMAVENPYAALTQVARGSTVWVIGGGEIYRELMPICDNLFVTVIRQEYECDTFFPEINERVWKKDRVSKRLSDENNPTMCFRVYTNRIVSKNKNSW
jgi:dihydrofolate reductase